MILIWTKEITTTKHLVERVHFQPNLLTSETKAGSYSVSQLPQAEDNGKTAVLYFNPKDSTLWHEYVDRPVSREEKMEQLINRLDSASNKYAELDKSTATLTEVRNAKIAQLKELCTAAIYDGFTSSLGHAFGFNELDQANFTQQSVMVMLEGLADTDVVQWKAKSGVVELTVTEFKTIVKEAKDHKLAMQARYWQLEGQVFAATTKTEVEAINW